MEMNNWDTSYKNSLMNESRMLIKINAILNLIGLKNYFFNSITFILMAFIGEFLIFKSLIVKFKFKNPKILFWSLLLFPSIFLWSSGILKEPLIILSFGLIVNSLIVKRTKWMNVSSFIIAALIIFKVKFYIFICFFPALISYIISEKTKFKPTRIIFTVCAIIAVIIFAMGKMNNSYNPLKILSQKQNDFITKIPTWKEVDPNTTLNDIQWIRPKVKITKSKTIVKINKSAIKLDEITLIFQSIKPSTLAVNAVVTKALLSGRITNQIF